MNQIHYFTVVSRIVVVFFVDHCICYWFLTGRIIKYANYAIIQCLIDREHVGWNERRLNPSETCIQCTGSADITFSLMFYRSVIKAHSLLYYKCDYEISWLDDAATALLHYRHTFTLITVQLQIHLNCGDLFYLLSYFFSLLKSIRAPLYRWSALV